MTTLCSCSGDQDVRGHCFTRIGDMPTMTADAILRARACPMTPYSIAYWFWNNHQAEYEKGNFGFWENDTYLRLIHEDRMGRDIREALWEIAHDEDESE